MVRVSLPRLLLLGLQQFAELDLLVAFRVEVLDPGGRAVLLVRLTERSCVALGAVFVQASEVSVTSLRRWARVVSNPKQSGTI